MKEKNIIPNDVKFYIVFMDTALNYIMGYGYPEQPAIIDIKYALEQFSNEPDLNLTIPDFKKVIDYVSIDIMNHKKFVKYMEKQEQNAQKAEKKAKKKKQ